jgi:hypothetical protein
VRDANRNSLDCQVPALTSSMRGEILSGATSSPFAKCLRSLGHSLRMNLLCCLSRSSRWRRCSARKPRLEMLGGFSKPHSSFKKPRRRKCDSSLRFKWESKVSNLSSAVVLGLNGHTAAYSATQHVITEVPALPSYQRDASLG